MHGVTHLEAPVSTLFPAGENTGEAGKEAPVAPAARLFLPAGKRLLNGRRPDVPIWERGEGNISAKAVCQHRNCNFSRQATQKQAEYSRDISVTQMATTNDVVTSSVSSVRA